MSSSLTTEPSNELRRSPLHDLHRSLGASFTEFAGWWMPLRYRSEIEEHHAVRRAAGIFDLSHMGEVEVFGSRAGEALDRSVVGAPSRLDVGQARYTMICDDSAGVVDDLVIYRLSNERFLVVPNAANTSIVARVLNEQAGKAAVVEDTTSSWALIALQGPESSTIMNSVTSYPLNTLSYYSVVFARIAATNVLLARTGYTGEDGFEIYCRPSDARAIWMRIAERGTSLGLRPAGLACRDTLRLEAGMPLYGSELTRDVNPVDAGLGRLVVPDKPGGFVGDEALAVQQTDKSRRVLVGLTGQGRRSPRCGYRLFDVESAQEVGRITSGALSPTLGHPIAMAYVNRELSTPGTQLVADVRGEGQTVVVTRTPFYRRPPVPETSTAVDPGGQA